MESDEDLLRAARRDPEAFCRVYTRHARPLWLWFRHQVGDPELANDLTAETFAQALGNLTRFRGTREGSGAAWLCGIARNLLRQYYKRKRVETAGRTRMGMPLRPYAAFDEIEERIDAEALGSQLRAAMGDLPAEQREALALRVLEQLNYPEIAAHLACTEPTVRKRVSRALSALNARLTGVRP
jgi:RNA polymerase sigma factor (sigma-70 family)